MLQTCLYIELDSLALSSCLEVDAITKIFKTCPPENKCLMIMRQPSMQNLPNDLDPAKQTLSEALEQVEVSDRISPQPESHSIKTPSVRFSQTAINTNINAETFSAQISKDLTIAQVASPVSEVEAGNDNTVAQILPNPNPQDSLASIGLVNRVSLSSQKPGEVKSIGSLFQPTRTVESESLTPNTIAQLSVQDDSKKLNTAGVAVVQNLDNTIVQYSDSAIHNPAERTVCQAMPPSSIEVDQTVYQRGTPQSPHSSTLASVPNNQTQVQLFHPSVFRDMFRASGSFTSRFTSIAGQFFHSIWRKIDLKQLQSRFHTGRQLAMVKTLEGSSSSRMNRFTDNAIASEERPSSEQYQKKLRELDWCRLSFAKELARNGKFRNAIAMAEQISETSHLFKDAQKLIQSWK